MTDEQQQQNAMAALIEQRAALATDVFNKTTDAFPGSREWLAMNAAEKALAAFDKEHPAVFGEAVRRAQAARPPRDKDPWEI